MQKTTFTSLLILSTLIFSNEKAISAGEVACTSKVTSADTAKKCVEEALSSKLGDLYNFAVIKMHTGDLTQCGTFTEKDRKSYFPKPFPDFKAVFAGAVVSGCVEHNADAYECSVPSQADVCYIAGNGANGVTGKGNISFFVSKSKKFIFSFFPSF